MPPRTRGRSQTKPMRPSTGHSRCPREPPLVLRSALFRRGTWLSTWSRTGRALTVGDCRRIGSLGRAAPGDRRGAWSGSRPVRAEREPLMAEAGRSWRASCVGNGRLPEVIDHVADHRGSHDESQFPSMAPQPFACGFAHEHPPYRGLQPCGCRAGAPIRLTAEARTGAFIPQRRCRAGKFVKVDLCARPDEAYEAVELTLRRCPLGSRVGLSDGKTPVPVGLGPGLGHGPFHARVPERIPLTAGDGASGW